MTRSFALLVSCAVLLASSVAPAPAAHAQGPRLSASVLCAPASAPGRILCDLTINASSGKLVWVDVLVVRAPLFARPLRSRVVGQLGALGTASAKLALVATELGKGTLQLRVRGVLCQDGPSGESCDPEVVPVSGVIEVGQASAPSAAPAP